MQPRVLLHVGMSKAGSTAIQAALVEKEHELRERGIDYPALSRHASGHHFDLFISLAHRGAASLVDHSPWHIMSRYILESSSPTTIISCEGFWLLREDSIRALHEYLIAAGIHVEVLLYLREPIAYFRSSYRQSLKGPLRSESPRQYISRTRRNLDYPRVTRMFRSTFGEAETSVKSYDALALKSNGLIDDFFDHIGARDLAPQNAGRINETPSDGVLRMVRGVNAMARFVPRRWHKKFVRGLLKWERLLRVLPQISNSELDNEVKQAVLAWDVDELRSCLGADVERLTKCARDLDSYFTSQSC